MRFRKARDIQPGDRVVIRSTLYLGGNWQPEVDVQEVISVELYAGRVRIYFTPKYSILRRPTDDVEIQVEE